MKLALKIFLILRLKNENNHSQNFYFSLKCIISLLISICFFNNSSYSQQIQISNYFKGTLFGLGWNQGWSETPKSGTIDFDCASCLNIGNVYLIAIEIDASISKNDTISCELLINNQKQLLNSSTRIGNTKIINTGDLLYNHFSKIDFSCVSDKITFEVPAQDYYHAFTGFYLVIECLDNSDKPVFYNLLPNSNTTDPDFVINSSQKIVLQSPDVNKDIGFALVGHTFNYMNGDASEVKINNISIGKIAGQDKSSKDNYGSGVRGHFFYENEILIGLDDDIPDAIMDSTDALARINSYFSDATLFFSCSHEVTGNKTNYAQAALVVYSSNCAVFPYSTSNDTNICINSPLQLFASGGIKYEWQPATGLSCTDCPNPTVTTDSSRLYTVQIWNNDSCSVVRPIKVNVLPLPKFSSITTAPSLCGSNTGSLTAVAAPETRLKVSYSLDGAAPVQSSTYTGNFSSLTSGTHNLQLIDGFGCITDTTVQIGINNPTDAQFTANPNSGAAPLFVDITNTSVSASNYTWFLNGAAQPDPFTGFLADTSGAYEIKLYAWDTDPTCADSFQLIVVAFDSLILEIPNIFSPNGDGINEIFGISATLPVSIKYTFLNRWGNEIATGSNTWQNGMALKGKVFYPLWNGIDATEGVYFYQLEITELTGSETSKEDVSAFRREGFVHVEK